MAVNLLVLEAGKASREGDYPLALEKFRAADSLLVESDPHGFLRSKILGAVANVHYYLGEVDSARVVNERNLRVISAGGLPDGLKLVPLNNLSIIWSGKGDYARSIDYARRAYGIASGAPTIGSKQLAKYASQLGTAFQYTAREDSALVYHRLALENYLADTTTMKADIGKTKMQIGTVLTNQENFTEGISELEAGFRLVIGELEETSEAVITARNNLGLAYLDLGRWTEAEVLLRTNVEVAENEATTADPRAKASLVTAYLNLSSFFEATQQYEHALTYSQLAESTITRSRDSPRLLAATYNARGGIFSSFGQWQRSLLAHRRSLSIRLNMPRINPEDVAIAYSNVATALAQLGNHEQAEISYENALTTLRYHFPTGHPLLTDIAVLRAESLKQLGRFAEAKAALRELLVSTDYDAVGTTATERARLALADLRLWPEQVDSAEYYGLRGLEALSNFYGEVHPATGRAHGVLLRLAAGRRDEARFEARWRSLRRAFGVKGPAKWADIPAANEYYSWLSLPLAQALRRFRATGEATAFTQAHTLLREAEMGSLWLRGGGTPLDELLPREIELKTLGAELYYEAWRRKGDERLLVRSLQLADQCQSRRLGAALRAAELSDSVVLPDSLRSIDLLCTRERAQIQRRKAILNRNTRLPETVAGQALIAEELALYEQEAAFRAALREQRPEYFAARFGAPEWELTTVREQLLSNGDEGIVSFLTTDSTLYVYLLTADTLVARRLNVGRITLQQRISRLVEEGINGFYGQPLHQRQRGTRQRADTIFTEEAQALHAALFGSLATTLPDRLLLVPDGPLNYLPFGALVNQAPSRIGGYRSYSFLADGHELRMAFSIAQQLRMQRSTPVTGDWVGFAPFADGSRQRTSSNALNEVVPAVLPRLRYSATELAGIKKLTGGQDFAAEQATKANLIAANRQASVLHLATHGIANWERPDDAFIALASDHEGGYTALWASDLYGISSPVELVVLSACATGEGAFLPGEGIQSLERAFAYGGARSLVASRWLVNDRSAAILMGYFYEALVMGEGRAAALDEAINRVRQSDLSAPYYWSGWTLRGIDDPLSFE